MKVLIMGLPGRGVGYVFEEEVFDDEVSSISATNIRKDMREKGEL